VEERGAQGLCVKVMPCLQHETHRLYKSISISFEVFLDVVNRENFRFHIFIGQAPLGEHKGEIKKILAFQFGRHSQN
jgi:hypothetical protein